MSDMDLKLVLVYALILILWIGFNAVYISGTSGNLETADNPLSGASVLDILNPWSEHFQSDYFFINFFIMSFLGFGLVVLIARFLRGV